MYVAATDAKKNVPGQVVSAERGGRVIVEQNQIGESSGGQYTDRLVKKVGSQGPVVVNRHLDHFVRAQGAGISAAHFVQQVCHFHFRKHIVAEAVVAQADRHPAPQHRRHSRRAHRVVHIRAGLVGDLRARLPQQSHLPGVDVNAVGKDTLGSGHPKAVQPLHRALPAAGQAVPGVRRVFGHVDVKAAALGRAGFQGGVGEGHTGVEAKGGRKAGGEWRVASCRGEAHILPDTRGRGRGSVPVGDFVAENRSQPAALYRAGDGVQAAIDGGLAGVVIDEGRRPVADSVHQAYLRRTLHPGQVQGPVQGPPELLQNFGKVFGWRAGNVHPPGKCAVKVGVGADLAGHQQQPLGVPAGQSGEALQQFPAPTDRHNFIAAVADRAVGQHPVVVVKGQNRCVVDEHFACLSGCLGSLGSERCAEQRPADRPYCTRDPTKQPTLFPDLCMLPYTEGEQYAVRARN